MASGEQESTDEDYPDIGDYGAIGDCRTVALVSSHGSVDWLCLPHFSGRAIFAALLDQNRGGRFKVAPKGPFRTTRRYLGDSNVLETRFVTDEGEATVTDCLTILPDAEPEGVLAPESELLRHVQVHRGSMELVFDYSPRPDFGRLPVQLSTRSPRAFVFRHRDLYLVFQCELPLSMSPSGDAATACVRLGEGERVLCSLSFVHRDMGILPTLGDDAVQRLEKTRRWWQRWADRCEYRDRHRDSVVRSALVLKMLQHSLTGAMVAAPTTSLPEVVGGDRNWDYRYCWLRDAALTFQAFSDLGYREEGEHFLSWLLHATRLTWPSLNVLYDVYGETRVQETELSHLHGYKGSRPVRTGNAASQQLQLDVYGAIIQAAADYVTRGGELDGVEGRLLAGFGGTICRRWSEPDSSIWEIRGEQRQYTYSKMMCWSGLHELLQLADDGHLEVPREEFTRARDAIAAAIEKDGFSDSCNSYVQTFGESRADASLLLAHRHYQDPDSPRMRGTFDYVDQRLARGALIFRYEPGSDGMSGQEGAFVMTSFWAVEYLAATGRIDEAERRFAELIGKANDLGLYAEEIEPDSGTALGNYPQAFSHVGLITAALALGQAHGRPGESQQQGQQAERSDETSGTCRHGV